MKDYTNDSDYKRLFEIEDLLASGEYDWEQTMELESEQTEIIFNRYKAYCNRVTEVINKLTSKYGELFNEDENKLFFGLRDYSDGIKDVFLHYTKESLTYISGKIGKPFVEFSITNKLLEDVIISFDRLFDLDIAEQYIINAYVNYANSMDDEIRRLEDKLDKLKDKQNRFYKLSSYEEYEFAPIDSFIYDKF